LLKGPLAVLHGGVSESVHVVAGEQRYGRGVILRRSVFPHMVGSHRAYCSPTFRGMRRNNRRLRVDPVQIVLVVDAALARFRATWFYARAAQNGVPGHHFCIAPMAFETLS